MAHGGRCLRFYWSIFIGYGQLAAGSGGIYDCQALVQPALQPDLTLYLDVPVAVGHARIEHREKDRLEREAVRFHDAVREAYLARAAAHSRFRVVDASRSLDVVQAEVRRLVDNFVARQT